MSVTLLSSAGPRARAGDPWVPSPIPPDHETREVPAEAETHVPLPSLMVADDDPAFRYQLVELLQDEGFTVLAAVADGDEAVEAIRDRRPDVVLLDMRMPRMDGITACSLIREQQPAVTVIVLSAYDDSALQRNAQEAGVYCYLVKGCRPELITQMVMQAWLHGRGADPAPTPRPQNP